MAFLPMVACGQADSRNPRGVTAGLGPFGAVRSARGKGPGMETDGLAASCGAHCLLHPPEDRIVLGFSSQGVTRVAEKLRFSDAVFVGHPGVCACACITVSSAPTSAQWRRAYRPVRWTSHHPTPPGRTEETRPGGIAGGVSSRMFEGEART